METVTDLLMLVPSRGRPGSVASLRRAFGETCTAATQLLLIVDDDDTTLDDYVAEATPVVDGHYPVSIGVMEDSQGMVHALNSAAVSLLSRPPVPFAVGFLGDDHRPRTRGWDEAYLAALRELGTGIVYGNDGFQGESLPTQCAMTSDIVATLGAMAPPTLKHLWIDNYWLDLGKGAGCIRYLPDVIVEHMHPAAGKATFDEGYLRVNALEMYRQDRAEYARIKQEALPAAIDAVRGLRGQWKLFDGDVARVSTPEYHRDRARAKHLEEDPISRARLELAAEFAKEAVGRGADSLSDLGCGDGGLLSLVQGFVTAWGYDFTPANAEGWSERKVNAELLDVFGTDADWVEFGDITAVTEVLEHLTDPFAAVKWIAEHSRFIVASSPWDERPDSFTDCHAWAFDRLGYRRLVEQGGYRVLRHENVGRFQVILGVQA